MRAQEESSGPSFLGRVLAVLVLAVAAWVLLKLVISVIAGVAWFVAVVVAIVGIFWAWRTLTA
jgi:protein-S-isoprenylcysteine O-methyltransferase Ste14